VTAPARRLLLDFAPSLAYTRHGYTFKLSNQEGAVPLVKVKDKYQVTLPASVRERAGVTVGDLLEAEVRGKKITLTPKALVDKDLKASLLASLAEAKRKGAIGPFKSAKAAIRALKRARV
jgi:AbrB family looped-hinge helix DNA binding protein